MVKYSIELFQVHRSFKVKFCVVVESDPDPRWGNSNQVISNSLFYNNRYLSMRPHPFLTFDITNRIERNEEWSSNRTFNMNRRERFTMCKKLSSFIEVFEDEKDLFYFEDDEYVYEGEHGLVYGIKKYHWPGRDRVKLFGSNQFLDFVRENECNSKESSLQVFFYVCTGLGKRIECMTNSGQFYNCWNYIDPFHRTQEYLRIFFEDSESSSAFFAIPYNKEEFEMRLKNI